jgi:hypothetical protein
VLAPADHLALLRHRLRHCTLSLPAFCIPYYNLWYRVCAASYICDIYLSSVALVHTLPLLILFTSSNLPLHAGTSIAYTLRPVLLSSAVAMCQELAPVVLDGCRTGSVDTSKWPTCGYSYKFHHSIGTMLLMNHALLTPSPQATHIRTRHSMEYLSLQDLPHRQHDSMHSHRMTSLSGERPMGSMAAAVSKPPSPFVSKRHSSRHISRAAPYPSRERRSASPRKEHRANSFAEFHEQYYLEHHRFTRTRSEDQSLRDHALNSLQNAQMRSSPPIQPNETGFADKLPSFSEVCFHDSAGAP